MVDATLHCYDSALEGTVCVKGPFLFRKLCTLVDWVNCQWIQWVSAKICRKVPTGNNKIRYQDILLSRVHSLKKMQETIKMKGEFLQSIYIVSRIGYLVLWPVDFTFSLIFTESEPLAKEHSILTGPFISDNEDLSKTSSTKLPALLGLAQRGIKLSPNQVIEKLALKTSP